MGLVKIAKEAGNSLLDFINGRGVSQEEFFVDLRDFIDGSKARIRISGYDKPFMEDPKTIEALEKAVDRSVAIQAIFPSGIETCLDSMKTKEYSVLIKRAEKEMQTGYTLFDDGLVIYLWNEKRKTTFRPEQEKGVYFRQYVVQPTFLADKANSVFESNWITIK